MPPELVHAVTSAHPAAFSPLLRHQLRSLAVYVGVLIMCFAMPLFTLAGFALHSDLYSHILLVPLVSVYLAWLGKNELPLADPPDRKLAALPLVAGLLLILGCALATRAGLKLAPADSLAWTTLSFVLLVIGACFLSLGKQIVRRLAFPLAFLIFLVPFPDLVKETVESFLQHRSADAAELLFGIIGTPFLRQGVTFQLPGFSLAVAPECSGIHSTLVLFISSLIASQLFLRSPWKRAFFVLVVLPLGILRNALRIVTIGELCVQVDPGFIDSVIHRRGGPFFFVISMFPFLLLLYYLRKTDARKHPSQDSTAKL
jgi:exosortase C (VPDSG-CTERM-specific)